MKYIVLLLCVFTTSCITEKGIQDPVMTTYNLLSDYVKSTGYKLPNKEPRTTTYVSGKTILRRGNK